MGANESENKLIISGNGSGHATAIMYAVVTLVIGIAGAILFFWLSNEWGYTITSGLWGSASQQRNELWIVFRIMAFVLLIALVLEALFIYMRCARTEVNVYEGEVNGKGVGLNVFFSWKDRRLSDFRLTYDQISAVDVTNSTILEIHTSGSRYRCFVKNAREIRDAIMMQKNQR